MCGSLQKMCCRNPPLGALRSFVFAQVLELCFVADGAPDSLPQFVAADCCTTKDGFRWMVQLLCSIVSANWLHPELPCSLATEGMQFVQSRIACNAFFARNERGEGWPFLSVRVIQLESRWLDLDEIRYGRRATETNPAILILGFI